MPSFKCVSIQFIQCISYNVYFDFVCLRGQMRGVRMTMFRSFNLHTSYLSTAFTSLHRHDRFMPIITRSMSKKQLKRTRDKMEPQSETDDSSPCKPEDSRPRKKRRLNHEEASTNDNTKENEGNTTNTKKATEKEMDRLKSKHRELLKEGYKCVVGVDEAGRGPLAGPVVVSAAFVPIDIRIDGITDSKKINDESEREKLYEIITATKEIKWSVTVLDHDVIDEYNILESSMMGMRQCVQKLHDQLVEEEGNNGVDYALADGNRDPAFDHPKGLKYEYIIKGDGNVYCIGAASIIAKVTRDRMMIEYDKKYPQWKFAQHKGYPTPFHKQLVWDLGPTEIHRKSFRPVKDWYQQNKPQIYHKMAALKKKRADERKKKKEEKKKKQKEDEVKKSGQKSIKSFFGKAKKKTTKKKGGKGKEKKKEECVKKVEKVDIQEEQKEESVDV
eukprot:168384_1